MCPECKRKEKWPPYRAAAAAAPGAAAGGRGEAFVDSDPDDPGLSEVGRRATPGQTLGVL